MFVVRDIVKNSIYLIRIFYIIIPRHNSLYFFPPLSLCKVKVDLVCLLFVQDTRLFAIGQNLVPTFSYNLSLFPLPLWQNVTNFAYYSVFLEICFVFAILPQFQFQFTFPQSLSLGCSRENGLVDFEIPAANARFPGIGMLHLSFQCWWRTCFIGQLLYFIHPRDRLNGFNEKELIQLPSEEIIIMKCYVLLLQWISTVLRVELQITSILQDFICPIRRSFVLSHSQSHLFEMVHRKLHTSVFAHYFLAYLC